MSDWREVRREGEAARARQRERLDRAAARYVDALAAIVGILGPENICSCDLPSDCGLPDEARDALTIAQDALAGKERTVG